jgi:hypothetical protein
MMTRSPCHRYALPFKRRGGAGNALSVLAQSNSERMLGHGCS